MRRPVEATVCAVSRGEIKPGEARAVGVPGEIVEEVENAPPENAGRDLVRDGQDPILSRSPVRPRGRTPPR